MFREGTQPTRQPLSLRSAADLKICSTALGIMPINSGASLSVAPSIVKVLPEPVWPYAKMQTL